VQAFILRSASNPGAALYPIAGRPLLERQLEWLYDSGVDEVNLELGQEAIDDEVEAWLRQSPLGLRVRIIKTGGVPNDMESLSDAVSHPVDTPVVSLMSNQVARVDLCDYFGLSAEGGVRLLLPICGLEFAPAEVWIAKPAERPRQAIEASGWGARLETENDAIALSSALLLCGGEVKGFAIQIPGSERAPGVWVARGTKISEACTLRAPVYVGAGSWIQSGAVVGPHCHIGEHVVVAGGAALSNIVVPPNSLVDQGGVRELGQRVHKGVVLRGMAVVLASPFLVTAEIARRCKEAVWG
jgi:hypothetical protein